MWPAEQYLQVCNHPTGFVLSLNANRLPNQAPDELESSLPRMKISALQSFCVLAIAVSFFLTGSWYILTAALMILYGLDYTQPAVDVPEETPSPGSLGVFSGGRDNNFNLIRILAALSVLLSHCYPLLAVSSTTPWGRVIETRLSDLAVNTFFIISGFLVARSFVRRPRLRPFLNARLLRLIPALFVVTSLSALVLGPFATSLPLSDYLFDPEVWAYIFSNSSLDGTEFGLPGVFADNPFPSAVNGSLWTLRYEGKMYAALTALGFLGVLRPGRRFWIFSAAFLTWTLALVWFPDLFEDASDHEHLRRLAICFFVGAFFDRIKNHLPLNAAGVALAFAICWGASRLESISAFYSFIEAFALGYGVFWFALRPKGWLLHYTGSATTPTASTSMRFPCSNFWSGFIRRSASPRCSSAQRS